MTMKTPETSKLFTRWKNPSNGVESLILTERAAPVQQSFYYTHPAWSADGRHLWFNCSYPPPGSKHAVPVLGVVDFEDDELRVFHETQMGSSRAWLDHDSGQIYWGNDFTIWRRGAAAGDQAERIGTLPAELVSGLRLFQLATHPTFSPDKKTFNLDVRLYKGDGTPVSLIGDMKLDGGAFRLWQRTEGFEFDHALFNPVDGDLQMFAHEFWIDGGRLGKPFDGQLPYHRIWLIRRGEKAAPFLREPVSHSGHEWWDASGDHVWYLHYGVGVKKVSLADRQEELVWPGALSHAHSSRCGRYLVADRMDEPRPADCHVIFRDTLTGREVEIVNRGPLAAHLTQSVHLHPHPHFILNDRYICYTTIVHDRVDIALVPVKNLIAATA